MARKKKHETGNFEVHMRCIVYKVVTVEGCTEEQAWDEPFEYATEETEQVDWEIKAVKRIE